MDQTKYAKIGHPYKSAEWRVEYNRRQREKRALKKAAKQPLVYIEKPANFLPPLRNVVISLPDKLHDVFGEVFRIDNDINKWYFNHSKRTNTLSETTQKQYASLVKRLKSMKMNMYDQIAHIVTLPVHHKAQFIKAWLAHLADQVADIYQSATPIPIITDYEQLIVEMMLYSELSKRTKREVKNVQLSQEVSQERLDNTVKWSEWANSARKYISVISNKEDATSAELAKACIAALYSMLPPIRLDYEDVNIVKKLPKKLNPNQNTLVLAGARTSAFYWFKFKNADAFARQGTLPIVQPINAITNKIIKRYMASRPGATKLFELPHFSEKVTEVALEITGKRFTNRLMRSSFIKEFYSKVTEGKLDLAEITKMMRQLHQTNLEINLSYIKKLAEQDEVD